MAEVARPAAAVPASAAVSAMPRDSAATAAISQTAAGTAKPSASGDTPSPASAPTFAASAFAPVTAPDARPGDSGGSTKRDARAADERPVDALSAKPAAVPAAGLVVPTPAPQAAPSTVSPAVAVAAPARTEVPADADVPRQIVQAIRMQWADGVGDARIKLQPEYLGDLSISIRVEHGAVTASLESNNATVREWIDSNQPMLRQALSEHGLQLDRLTVTDEAAQPDWTGNEHPEQKQQQEDAQQAQRARRRTDENAPAFEMVA